MDHIFYTQWNPPPNPKEVNSGEVIVETAGYVPAQTLIESMLEAGIRLQQGRGFEFEQGEDIPDNYIDPTRSPGFDLADAAQISMSNLARLEEQANAAKKRKNDKEVTDAKAAFSAAVQAEVERITADSPKKGKTSLPDNI